MFNNILKYDKIHDIFKKRVEYGKTSFNNLK